MTSSGSKAVDFLGEINEAMTPGGIQNEEAGGYAGGFQMPYHVASSMEFVTLTDEALAEAPKPCGWKILIQEPSAKDYRGSILMTDQTKEHIQNSNYIGKVIALGPLAYNDPGKFGQSEPWCKPGDVVTFKRYAGQVLQYQDVYMRLLNDNEIHSVVPNHDLVSIL